MADVRLTDLEVIQRYSIAVRGETAERDELVATLRADLAWLQSSGGRRTSADDDVPEKDAATPRAAAKPTAKPAAKSTAKRVAKPAAKKTAKPSRLAKAPARRSR